MIANHTAGGSLAGYLFQPERALFHLATSPVGSVVGIETLDDVSVILPDQTIIYEQDKHSIAKKSAILSTTQSGFWNTFGIWLAAIAANEINLEISRFQLVTNTSLSSGAAFDLMQADGQPVALSKIIKSLRKEGQQAPPSLKPYVEMVLRHSDKDILALLVNVKVLDKTKKVSGDELKNKVTAALPLPSGHELEIIQSLLGWIDDTTLALIRNGQPAWLRKEAFVERYLTLVTRFHDRRFLNETAEALIPVSEEKRSEHRHRLFVKQLVWLGFDDSHEQLIESIDDFVRGSTERIRLAKAGYATLQDFRDFENRLMTRWRNIFRSLAPKLSQSDESTLQELGKSILFKTLDHREPLAGYSTQEWYLTRGSYHRLADKPEKKPRIGWHPSFEGKCKGSEEEMR